jgi:hypothetical protein
MVTNKRKNLMIKAISLFSVLCVLFTTPVLADTDETPSRCQVYGLDIGMGLERAGFPAPTTCSSTPTKNEAEFEFNLTLTDGRSAKMTCSPSECNKPQIVEAE